MTRAIPLNTVLTWAFAAVAAPFAVPISVTILDRLIAMIVR